MVRLAKWKITRTVSTKPFIAAVTYLVLEALCDMFHKALTKVDAWSERKVTDIKGKLLSCFIYMIELMGFWLVERSAIISLIALHCILSSFWTACMHAAGSWKSTREVGRARGKLGEHAGSWESTRKIGRARGKLAEPTSWSPNHEPFLF